MFYYISDLSVVVLFSREKEIVVSNFLAGDFLTLPCLDRLNNNKHTADILGGKTRVVPKNNVWSGK